MLAWAAPAGAQLSSQSSYGTNSPLAPVAPQPGAENERGVQQKPVEFRLGAQETLTDNVNLEPSGTRHSDAVTRIEPGMRLHYASGRILLQGDVSLPMLFYARTSANNRVIPQASLFGRVEAIDRLFWIEGAAYVSQSYFSAFGATSPAIENNPANAYNSHTYRITPYLRYGTGDYTFEARDNNIWSNATSTPAATDNFYTNEVLARVRRAPTPLGWSAEYRHSDLDFGNGQSQIIELARANLIDRVSPELELSASAGYENDRLLFSTQEGFIYGVAAVWRPSARLRLDANWEHRFFGSAYHVVLEDRTPLTVWSVEATREITSYPQQIAELGTGNVASLLDTLFTSRIPDAAQRQQFVQQFIDERGLPQTLSGPIALYTRQVHLQETFAATFGLLGVRNSVFFRAWRSRTEPLPGSDLALEPILDQGLNTTQVGGGVTWNHTLAQRARLATSFDQRYVTANDSSAATRELTLSSVLSMTLSQRTALFGGVRYQRLRSDVTAGYDETAVFAGVNYTFY